MTVPNGDADNPARARPAHEVQASAVSISARPVTAWARRAVALRPPLAPILGHSATLPLAGPGSRMLVPELLAEDALLDPLLTTAHPQSLSVQPLRDPVGLALGVVARLIVAGCAAATVAMLLVGTMPAPFRPAPARPAAPPAAAGPAAKAVRADRALTVEPVANDAQRAGSAPPAPPTTLSVGSVRADSASQSALDAHDLERLVRRGENLLAHGDIAAARLLLGRAAEAHDAQATLSLAASYDPEVLRRLPVLGIKPDIGAARGWYEKAARYGSAEAIRRLARLPDHDP